MEPNFKRKTIVNYIHCIIEGPLTDEDLDMINYVKGLESECDMVKIANKQYKDTLAKIHCLISKEYATYGNIQLNKFELLKIIEGDAK